jgi:hypothetical protein
MKDECKSFSKYRAVFLPRCDCKACWNKYFMTHLGEVAALEHGYKQFGNRGIDAVRGIKARKQLLRFVAEQGSPLEAYNTFNKAGEDNPERIDANSGDGD